MAQEELDTSDSHDSFDIPRWHEAGALWLDYCDEYWRHLRRELEVMRLIARGYSYKEVAKELFISIKTVETHVSAVLRKLQLSSRHELTRWAAERRLL